MSKVSNVCFFYPYLLKKSKEKEYQALLSVRDFHFVSIYA